MCDEECAALFWAYPYLCSVWAAAILLSGFPCMVEGSRCHFPYFFSLPAWNLAVEDFHIHSPHACIHKTQHLFQHLAYLCKILKISQQIFSPSLCKILQIFSPSLQDLALDHVEERKHGSRRQQPGQAVRRVQEPAQEVRPRLHPRPLLPGIGSP